MTMRYLERNGLTRAGTTSLTGQLSSSCLAYPCSWRRRSCSRAYCRLLLPRDGRTDLNSNWRNDMRDHEKLKALHGGLDPDWVVHPLFDLQEKKRETDHLAPIKMTLS